MTTFVINKAHAALYEQAFGPLPPEIKVMANLPQLGAPPILTMVPPYEPLTPELRRRLSALAEGIELDQPAPMAKVSLTRLAAFYVCEEWAYA
ncbi:MAG: hypothetical protein EON54_06905 [Alcaligenaceae bacterium]|nr:MAG: hypothetical protein EON54_06905 [Alcaligenaceae bacterium]